MSTYVCGLRSTSGNQVAATEARLRGLLQHILLRRPRVGRFLAFELDVGPTIEVPEQAERDAETCGDEGGPELQEAGGKRLIEPVPQRLAEDEDPLRQEVEQDRGQDAAAAQGQDTEHDADAEDRHEREDVHVEEGVEKAAEQDRGARAMAFSEAGEDEAAKSELLADRGEQGEDEQIAAAADAPFGESANLADERVRIIEEALELRQVVEDEAARPDE